MPNLFPKSQMKVKKRYPRVNHCTIPNFQPEGNWEPSNEVESLCLAKCLVGFELGTFQFFLNALTHWATFKLELKFTTQNLNST